MTADNVDSLLCCVGEVSGGRLRRMLKDACAGLKDVTALSLQSDPDRPVTEAGHRDGRWFAAPVASFVRVWKTIHLTGLHYAVVSAGDIVKPYGKPYCNEDRQWFEEAAQFARWPGYVPFDRIADAENVESIVRPLFAGSQTQPFVWRHASDTHSVRAGHGWQSASCAGRNGGRNRRTSPTEKHKGGKTRRDPSRPLQTADVTTKPAAAPTAQGGPKDELPKLKSAVAVGGSQRSSRAHRRLISQLRTIDETAEILNVSPRTVRRLIDSGALPVHRFGHLVRISDDGIAVLLAASRNA